MAIHGTMNEIFDEFCKEDGTGKYNEFDQWYNYPPDTWTKEQKHIFDMLSEFATKANSKVENVLLSV